MLNEVLKFSWMGFMKSFLLSFYAHGNDYFKLILITQNFILYVCTDTFDVAFHTKF